MWKKKTLLILAIMFILGVGIIMVIKYTGNQEMNDLLTKDNIGIVLPAGEDDKLNITYTPTKKIYNNPDGSKNVIDYGTITFVYEDGIWKTIDQARSLRGSGIDCIVESDGENLAECLDWNWTSIQLRTSERTVSVSSKQVPLRVYEWVTEPVLDSKTQQVIDYNTTLRLKSEKSLTFSMVSNAKTEPVNNFEYGNIIHFGETSTTVQLVTTGGNLKDSSCYLVQNQYNYGAQTIVQILNNTAGTNKREGVITWNFTNASIPAGQIVQDSKLCLNITANDLESGEWANISVKMVYNNWTATGLDGHVSGNSNIQGGTFNGTTFNLGDTTDSRKYKFDSSGTAITSCLTSTYDTDLRGLDQNASNIFFGVDYADADVHVFNDTCSLYYSFDTLASGNGNPQGISVNETNNKLVVTDVLDDEWYYYWVNGTYISSCDTASTGFTNPTGIEWFWGHIYIADPTLGSIGQFDEDCSFDLFYVNTSESKTGNGEVSEIRFNSSGYLFAFDNVDATVYTYDPSGNIMPFVGGVPWVEGTGSGSTNTIRSALTYGKRPSSEWYNSVPDERKSFGNVGTYPINQFYCWNITNASQYAYTNNYANLTFYMVADLSSANELTDAVQFNSKEHTFVAGRPYLNITYDVSGAEPPAGDCWQTSAGKIMIPPTCQYAVNTNQGYQ